jgi:hypothetical protein
MKRLAFAAAAALALVVAPAAAADRPAGTGAHCAEQLTALEQRMGTEHPQVLDAVAPALARCVIYA